MRWRKMEQLKRETIEVESKVRGALLVLEQGRRELEAVVGDAKEVVSSIEMAEKSEHHHNENHRSLRVLTTKLIALELDRPFGPRDTAVVRLLTRVLHFRPAVRHIYYPFAS